MASVPVGLGHKKFYRLVSNASLAKLDYTSTIYFAVLLSTRIVCVGFPSLECTLCLEHFVE